MTKSSEYIARVLEQVISDEQSYQTYRQGAFLTAALSIISEVESPLKERALVSLAVLACRGNSRELAHGQRAA